jgi:hypothetical protein
MDLSIEFIYAEGPPRWASMRRKQFHEELMARGLGQTHDHNCTLYGIRIRLRDYPAEFAEVLHENCIASGLLDTEAWPREPIKARIHWSEKHFVQ